jgi:hypothetical protein
MNMGQEISSLKISDDEVDHFAQTIELPPENRTVTEAMI